MDAILLILLSSLGLMVLVLAVTFVLWVKERKRYLRLKEGIERRAAMRGGVSGE